jgi:hypothetical protein
MSATERGAMMPAMTRDDDREEDAVELRDC